MFWDNLKSACDERGIKVTPLLKELNISSGGIGKWQRGGNVSSETLLKLSDRLGVSIDFLVKGEEPAQPKEDPPASPAGSLTYDEQLLLTWYRALPSSGKLLCSNYVKGAYDMSVTMGEERRSS